MSDHELNLLAEKVADKLYEKLTRKKYQKSKSEKRQRISMDIRGIRRIKKSEIIK